MTGEIYFRLCWISWLFYFFTFFYLFFFVCFYISYFPIFSLERNNFLFTNFLFFSNWWEKKILNSFLFISIKENVNQKIWNEQEKKDNWIIKKK